MNFFTIQRVHKEPFPFILKINKKCVYTAIDRRDAFEVFATTISFRKMSIICKLMKVKQVI